MHSRYFLVIYHKFIKFLAVIMIFLELYSILIFPCWKELQAIKQLSKKSENKARNILLFCIAAISGVIMFVPISWNIELPGETIYQYRSQVVIPETGYLRENLSVQAVMVEKGDTLFRLNSPQLDFAIAELSATIKFDNILFAIQQVDEKHFHESRITEEKIDSDRIALTELQRRKSNLDVKAEKNGTFLLHHYPIHKNSFLAKGMITGEIVSGNIVINAYADDREISNISPGAHALIYTKDSFHGYSAEVTEVNAIPVQLTESPVLQSNGGSVPVYFDEKTKQYLPDRTLYRIVLKINGNHKLTIGRFVTVKISHSEQLFKIINQFIISAFRKEF